MAPDKPVEPIKPATPAVQFDLIPGGGAATLRPVTDVAQTPESQYGPSGRVATFGHPTLAPQARPARHRHVEPGKQPAQKPPPITSARLTRQELAVEDEHIVLKPLAIGEALKDAGFTDKR